MSVDHPDHKETDMSRPDDSHRAETHQWMHFPVTSELGLDLLDSEVLNGDAAKSQYEN